MISEYEEMMSCEDLQNPIFFPKYIVIRTLSDNDAYRAKYEGSFNDSMKEQKRLIKDLKLSFSERDERHDLLEQFISQQF